MNTKILMVLMAILLLVAIPSVSATTYYSDLNVTMIHSWFDLNETAAGPGTIVNNTGAGNGTYDINVQVNQLGKLGTAYYFNGLDGNASLGNNLVRDGNFSLSFWFKPVAQLQNPGFVLARALGGTATTSYVFGYFNESLYFQMYSTAGANKTATIASGITEGEWHLAVGTFNRSTGVLTLSVDNGALSATATGWSGTVYTGATPTWIGKDARSLVGTKWKGTVDQVVYYTAPLTNIDIDILWNGGNGIQYGSYPTSDINIGQTTITDFTQYGSFIAGGGSAIGGDINIRADSEFGSGFNKIVDDGNTYLDIATDPTGNKVYVVTDTGRMYISNDAGNTWTQGPFSGKERYGVAVSDINDIVVAANWGGAIDISYDGGTTWGRTIDGNLWWHDVAISYNGQYILVTGGVGDSAAKVRVSSDWGANWSSLAPGGLSMQGFSAAMTQNGKEMIVGTGLTGYIFKSNDYGVTWTQSNAILGAWLGASYARLGNYAFITAYVSNKGYYTDNNGGSWSELSQFLPAESQNIGSSSDGSKTIFVTSNAVGNNVFVSTDYVNTFTSYEYDGTLTAAAISDGLYSYMVGSTGEIYRYASITPGLNKESCQYTDNNGVSWATADYNSLYNRCQKDNIVVIPNKSYTFNFRAQDLVGSYAYGIATQQYTGAEGSVTQFIVRDQIGIALANVDLNLYRVDGSSRIYFTTIRTDSTGSVYAILKSGTTYSLDVFYNGVYTVTNQILIANITPIYITINTTPGGIVLPDVNQIYISWAPGIDFIYSDVLSLIQTVSSQNVKDFNVRIYQYRDFNTSDLNIRYSAASACNKNCTITTLLTGFTHDPAKPFYVDLNLGLDDGERVIQTHKYVRPSAPAPQDLIRNAKADWACSLDGNIPCGPTIIISIVLTIIALGAIVLMINYTAPQGLAVIALAMLGVFTYVEWFYWIAYFIIVLVTILYVGKGVVE